jgi:hypothetical protein
MNQVTVVSIQPINITNQDSLSYIESLIQQSMSLPVSERLYTLQCIQSFITDTLPTVHTVTDTTRLIILYHFISSVLSHTLLN